jgi:hypothetical protein
MPLKDFRHEWRNARRELKPRGWTEQDLPGLGKGDKSKVALAYWLRHETTMKLKTELMHDMTPA